MSSVCCAVLIAVGLIAVAHSGIAAPVQVGVLPSPGSQGLSQALAGQADLQVTPLTEIEADSLAQIDVLVLGAASGLPGSQREAARAVRAFVRTGGAAILHHNATGYKDWLEPLFPEVAVGTARSETQNVSVGAASPLTAGLPPTFTHAYWDHITLETGPQGQVAVVDDNAKPVVVFGAYGDGRVVVNGMATGLKDNLETPPTDAELQLLLNAVRWAGEKAASAGVSREQRLHEAIMAAQAAAGDRTSNTDWYAKQMLNEAYIARPPVEQLGGRMCLFASRYIYQYGYERTRLNCRQLRWLGVTDIFIHDQSGARIEHPTDIPGAKPRYTDKDPLMDLVRAAHEEGLDVWGFMHSGAYPPEMCARDAQGNLYLRGNRGGIDDVFSQQLRGFLGQVLDEYATKYNQYGNFRGIYYDELFFNSIDCHGDDLDRFAQFCQERFGEQPPADVGDRFARGREWVEPQDVWWRRYVLFRNWGTTEFLRDLTDMCHQRGLEMMLELRPTVGLSGWRMGLDNVALTRIGADCYFVASGDYCEPGFPYPKTVMGGHVYGPTWGYWNTISLRGHEAGMYFVFNQLWRPLVIGLNPNKPEAIAQHFQNLREWSNAESLTRAALLTNEVGMILRHGNTQQQSENELRALDRFSHYQDLDLVYSQARELHPNYRALVALPESVQNLAPDDMDALQAYVEKGGVIISLGSRWSIARADLTDEKDVTGEMVGIRITGDQEAQTLIAADKEINLGIEALTVQTASDTVEVLASFKPSGSAAVTAHAIGRGKVIAVHFDPYLILGEEANPVEEFLADLIAQYSRPEIRGSGQTKIVTTLKKGNWVAVSLFAQQFPAHGQVSIDTKALGLPGEEFRLLSHARNREYAPPGKFTSQLLWGHDLLAGGVEVTIPVRTDLHLQLPSDLGLDAYSEEPAQNAEWLDKYLRERWDSRRGQGRSYEHEILVVCPPNEAGPEITME